MKVLRVQDVIDKLQTLPPDLPVKYHKGQGICREVRDCRLVVGDAVWLDEEVLGESLFVCIY